MAQEVGKPSGEENSSVAVSVEKVMEEIDRPKDRTNPSWFTPKRLLVIFCVINMLNYVDRGAIASNGVNGNRRECTNGTCSGGSGIQGNFNLNNFEDGVISSAFMVGLLVASPIFASLTKSFNPFRLIGVGLSVWTLAVVGCGMSFDFWTIAICRMLVGVGEASFISLAAPFIDDNAPAAKRTAWLGIFYMCIPTGVALGYVYGGWVGNHFNWRFAFYGEAILMLPFAILGFIIKPLQLKGFSFSDSKRLTIVETNVVEVEVDKDGARTEMVVDQSSKKASRSGCICSLDHFSTFGRDMKTLLLDKVYVINILGYIAYTFVVGAYSYWGPKAGQSIYNMRNADMLFGGVTIVGGIVGTLAGGFILDFMKSSINNAFKLLSATTLLGAISCFAAFCFKSMYAFLALFLVGEILIFAAQGPVNFVCLHTVRPSLRPLSMAMNTVAIHIFGDVPSAPLVGLVQDHINNWRKTALMLTSIFLVAVVVWFSGIFIEGVDRFNEDSELPVTADEQSNGAVVLDEKTTLTREVSV